MANMFELIYALDDKDGLDTAIDIIKCNTNDSIEIGIVQGYNKEKGSWRQYCHTILEEEDALELANSIIEAFRK